MIIREYHKGDFNAIMDLWCVTGMGSRTRGDDETTVERSIEMGGRMLVMCNDDSGRKYHWHLMDDIRRQTPASAPLWN